MQIISSGTLEIVSNHETRLFQLDGFECGYNPYEALGYIDFDYAEIFEMVCDTLEKQGYAVPASEEAFNNSPLWKELGFIIVPDFRIVRIDKDIEIEHYMTYGQNAAVSIDLESKAVVYNEYYRYRNDLDNLIFNWEYKFDAEENQLNGSDILDDIAQFYSRYLEGEFKTKELYEKTKEYAQNLYSEEGDPMPDDYVEGIFNVIKQRVELED